MPLTCPFANHKSHLEVNFEQLQSMLISINWPPTANLIPPGDLRHDAAWRHFYAERIQLGVLSLYPRLLTEPLPFLDLSITFPYPLIELLMVPHWSHITELRQGISTRRQRIQGIMYACCELALLHRVLAQTWPNEPPLIYAITHQGLGDFFQFAHYHCLPPPPALLEIYQPAIERLLQRDDPHRHHKGRFIFAHTPSDSQALEQIRQRTMVCVQRAEALLAKFKD